MDLQLQQLQQQQQLFLRQRQQAARKAMLAQQYRKQPQKSIPNTIDQKQQFDNA